MMLHSTRYSFVGDRSPAAIGAVVLATVISMGWCTAVSAQSNNVSMGLQLWNDPAFKLQFAMSYMAETDIEPRVTADEREDMMKILDLISADKMDEAARMIEKKLLGESTKNDKKRGSKSDDVFAIPLTALDLLGVLEKGKAVSAVFDFTLANIYFQQEKLEQAAAAYQSAVTKFPKFRRAWRNLALIHVRHNEFDKALPALTRVVELGGGDGITYGLLGFAYSNVDNNLAAESAFRMAVLLDPNTMDWTMGLVRSFFKQQRFADAASLCGQLISASPDRADLWLLQANAYIGLNQPRRAAENYEIVARMGKATPDSMNMLGDIYINEDLYDLAVKCYIDAMVNAEAAGSEERAPGVEPEAKTGVKLDRPLRAAKVLAARGANAETLTLIEHIESHQRDQLTENDRKDLLKLRARIAMAEQSGEEEARVLEEIVALDPLDGEALILLGQHSTRAGDIEKAVFYYERAAALEKFEADAKVRHAQLLVRNGRYDEALPLLRRAQQVRPRDNVQQYLEQVERVAKSR